MHDFLDLSPVELFHYFEVKNEHDKVERAFWEDQFRLNNVFIVNSNPYLKQSSRIKEPKQLYKISTEIQEYNESKKETTYANLSADELEGLKQFIQSLDK